jgi:hypothetical protein
MVINSLGGTRKQLVKQIARPSLRHLKLIPKKDDIYHQKQSSVGVARTDIECFAITQLNIAAASIGVNARRGIA